MKHHSLPLSTCLIVSFLLRTLLVYGFQASNNHHQQQQQRPAATFSKLLSATTTTSANTSHENVHLLSLQWPSEDLSFSKPVKDVWRWKDAVLGDGRDFFVPKPKTLSALNQYVLQEGSSSGATIQECAVLSNCARFEIIIWSDESNTTASLLQERLSRCLAHQVKSYRQRPFPMLQDQLSRLDSPRLIDTASCDGGDDEDNEIVQELNRHWNCLSGVEAVSHHLCLVAAGMALRPNRPDRPVPFQPFSSRDAHILLQLKRTPFEGSRIKLLLDAALSAGKAARDPQQVPELEELRNKYGETGNSKYSIDPPAAVTESVAKAAMARAIAPAVDDCVQRLQAMGRAEPIVRLRERVDTTLEPRNGEETKWLRKQLHAPTMDLRQGKEVDIDALIKDLESQLAKQRSPQL